MKYTSYHSNNNQTTNGTPLHVPFTKDMPPKKAKILEKSRNIWLLVLKICAFFAVFKVFGLLPLNQLYAQDANIKNENQAIEDLKKNIDESAAETVEGLQTSIYEQLINYQQRTLVPGVTFFISASTGISAFPLKSVKNELETVSKQLVGDLNISQEDSEAKYKNFNKTFIPPFYFSVDFRVFYKFFGFGTSYDYFNYAYGKYSIGIDAQENDVNYENPITFKYNITGHGMGFYGYLHRSVFIPQINIIAGLGYAFNVANANINLTAKNTFSSRNGNFKSIGHGVRGLLELMVIHKHLTYGFGILVDGTSFGKFTNNSGTLIHYNGKQANANILPSPLFYVRIGVRF